MGKIVAHLWRPAACIQASGEDCFPFLQGQFTNNLDADGCHYGLWLDRKGKIQADSFVLRRSAEAFFLISYFSPAKRILERLEPYIIADDVALADRTGEASGISVWGTGAKAFIDDGGIQRTGGSGSRHEPGGIVFQGRRNRTGGFECLFWGDQSERKSSGLRDRLQAAHAEWADAERVERDRIAAGIPAIPVEVGPGDLPQEAGLENDALSFSKGCYLGQEVMARIRAMGEVRRTLAVVRLEGRVPESLPAPLCHTGNHAGELRCLTASPPHIGLAMIRKSVLRKGQTLAIQGNKASCIHIMDSQYNVSIK